MIPIAILDPVLKFKSNLTGQYEYVDFPLTYLADYYFGSVKYPMHTRDRVVDSVEKKKLFSILETGPVEVQDTNECVDEDNVLKPFYELMHQFENNSMVSAIRGPGFRYPFAAENYDIRPWKEIERDYQKFLIVPQPIWCEHFLGFIRNISPESVDRAGCSKLLDCMRKGRAKLVLQIPWEGGWWAPDIYSEFNSFLERMNLPFKSVVLILPQSKPVEDKMREWYNINAISFSYFESFPREFTENGIENTEISLKSFREDVEKCIESFSCRVMNHTGNATWDRVCLQLLLQEIVGDKGRYNISNLWQIPLKPCLEQLKHELDTHKQECERVDKGMYDLLYGRVEKELENCSIHCQEIFDSYDLREDLWRFDSALEIFAETIDRDFSSEPCYGTNMLHFLTEKTLKTIASMKPFIILGNKGAIDDIKSRGYKTFERWWDESYSNENITIVRILKAFKEVKKLMSYSDEDFHNILVEMKDTLRHNYDLRMSKIKTGNEDFYNCLRQICQL